MWHKISSFRWKIVCAKPPKNKIIMSGHCDIQKTVEPTSSPEPSGILFNWMPLSFVLLNIEQKFFRDANLLWVNKESWSTARLTWPLMIRRRTNQLLGLAREDISTTVTVCHCIMGRQVKRIRLPFKDFGRVCSCYPFSLSVRVSC